MALLYPVVVPCSVILSLTLDEENSERLMLKYYVFLLKAGISDHVAAVRQYRGFVDSYLQTVEGIKKERIEDFVIDRIMKIVNDPEAINEIIKNVLIYQEKGNRVLPTLEAELADVEKRKANLLNAIEMGIVNATTKQMLDELEMQCNNLQIEIAREQMENNLIDGTQTIPLSEVEAFSNCSPVICEGGAKNRGQFRCHHRLHRT